MGRFSYILLVDQVGKGMWLSGAVQRHPVGGSGREADMAEQVSVCERDMQASRQTVCQYMFAVFSFSLSHHLCGLAPVLFILASLHQVTSKVHSASQPCARGPQEVMSDGG